MNVLDLFCGAAGGWSIGMEMAGYRTVAACEIDPWRRAVFAARHPGCIMYDDVRELTADRLRADLHYLPEVIVGSPPCQEISTANTKGTGITDDHLFWEWARLVFEIRPLWCAAENSPNARSAGIDGILDALDQAGYAAWPCVVGADNAGANHRRKRLWLIAADADRIGSGGLARTGRKGWTQQKTPVIDALDAARLGCDSGRPAETPGWPGPLASRASDGNDADPDGRIASGTRRDADGCVVMGAPANGNDARHAEIEPGLRRRAVRAGRQTEPAQAHLHDDADAHGTSRRQPALPHGAATHSRPLADTDREGLAVGPSLTGNHGEELPAALRDIGLAWPDWNTGLAGLAASCAAAGFGAVDDGPNRGLPARLRNRAIAALGDAVIPQIPEAIGIAMRKICPPQTEPPAQSNQRA